MEHRPDFLKPKNRKNKFHTQQMFNQKMSLDLSAIYDCRYNNVLLK